MPRPTDAGSVAEGIYEQLIELQYAELSTDYALLKFLGALGSMFQLVVDVSSDDPITGRPGWSQVLDPNTVPAIGIPWLAQLLGVAIPPAGLTEAEQRQLLLDAPNQKRGTRAAMIGAIKPYLTGPNPTILFYERTPDAYSLTVSTRTDQTPNPTYAERALRSQKPAGLNLTYQVIPGQDFLQLRTNYATFQAVKTAYATFDAVRLG